jgi:hypothetical protein
MINNPRRNPEFFDRETSKRKSDIWYYTIVKKGAVSELNLNFVEVTIPWNDAIIKPQKVKKNSDPSYVHTLFVSNDVQTSALTETRRKKIKKYEPMVKEANSWLQDNLDEIRIKHKVSKVKVNSRFIIISNLGIVRKRLIWICVTLLILTKEKGKTPFPLFLHECWGCLISLLSFEGCKRIPLRI